MPLTSMVSDEKLVVNLIEAPLVREELVLFCFRYSLSLLLNYLTVCLSVDPLILIVWNLLRFLDV